MSIQIRPAGPDDRDAVCNLLHEKMSSRIPLERWRRIVDGRWSGWRDDFGVIAEADGELAGFLGVVYAERPTPHGIRRFGNLTSWYITKPYRGRGVGWRMLQAAMSDPTVSYTTFSSNPPALRLMAKAGLVLLDDRRLIWDGKATKATDVVVTKNPDIAGEGLSERSRQILADHAGLNVLPYLIEPKDQPSYLVLVHVKKKGADIAYHEALHVEDPAAFTRHAGSFASAILPPKKALLSVDSRFCTGAANPDRVEEIEAPRFVRPTDVEPANVDFLYSEIVLLDLKLY